ncbi:MAG: hypothetical protein JST79_21510 [Acidobacteria bacterium]|jgi:hypothetical protein|nr:hypothetical protein [Acidobacteriota bacterium]
MKAICKGWMIGIALLFAVMTGPAWTQQNAADNSAVPKYNKATEAVFKGVVQEVRERHCPISGSLGEHFLLKVADGSTIEVHITTVKFMKDYGFSFAKGDEVEVTGSKVKFEGVDTILAREIKRGNDVFAFRDKDGNPVW